MGKIWLPGGGGGGISSDDVTLVKANVPSALKALTADSDDEIINGTLNPITTSADVNVLSNVTYVKWNDGTKLFEIRRGTMPNNGAINASLNCGQSKTLPAGYTTGGTVTANSLASQTPGNVTSGHILNGYSAWSNGVKVTGSIPVQGGSTITPGTAAKTAIAAGRYASGNIYVAGSPNLIAPYIKKGVSIFGVTGTWEGYVSSPLYFFNNGTWSNLQTPGMTNASVNGNFLQLNRGSFGRLNQLVDLTGYSYLKIEATVPNATTHGYVFQIGISSSSTTTTESNMTARKAIRSTSSSVVTGILDISSYQGKYYIYAFDFFTFLQASAGGDIDGHIYKIFLSKT